MKIAKDGRNAVPDADGYFDDIYNELDGLESMLEDLRKANATLREWGYEGEQKAETLEEELSNLYGELDGLKEKNNVCQE